MERNLLLIETMKDYLPGKKVEEGHKITKPQDLVRLYDIIIQVSNLDSMTSSYRLTIGLCNIIHKCVVPMTSSFTFSLYNVVTLRLYVRNNDTVQSTTDASEISDEMLIHVLLIVMMCICLL